MTSEQFEAFLAQAGVDAGAVGAAERLLLPEPQVDEARTTRIGTAFVPPALLHVRSDALSAAGIDAGFDEDARTLVLSARQDLAFGLAESGAPFTSGEAGGIRFHVATDRPSAFGLWSVAGPLAIGSIDARAIELRVVHAWPAPTGLDDSGVQSDSGVEVPVNDSGVEQALNHSGVEPDPNDSGVGFHSGVVRPRSRWDETLAAGRIARAMEPGASQAATIAARRWTRGLTADQRTLIERFAIVRRATSPPASIACRRTSAPPTRRSTSPGRRCAGIATTWTASACCCARPARGRR